MKFNNILVYFLFSMVVALSSCTNQEPSNDATSSSLDQEGLLENRVVCPEVDLKFTRIPGDPCASILVSFQGLAGSENCKITSFTLKQWNQATTPKDYNSQSPSSLLVSGLNGSVINVQGFSFLGIPNMFVFQNASTPLTYLIEGNTPINLQGSTYYVCASGTMDCNGEICNFGPVCTSFLVYCE